ncbi:MAG TPA: glycosyltransferase family 4 protein [Alphaproteobacteria bacterium]
MNVLVLLHDSYGAVGGIAKFNRDLLGGLAADPRVSRISVLPRVAPDAPPPASPKLEIRPRPAGGKPGYLAAAFGQRLNGGRADLVIAGHLRLLPAAIAARPKDRPLWMIVHGIDAWEPRPHSLDPILVKAADRVIAVSGVTRDRMARWSGLPPERFALLPNCIDRSAFTPGPPDPALQARYGLGGRRVLMTLARLAERERYKGIDEVLDALPSLVREFPDLSYLVVGDGPDRARLKAKSSTLGLADRVVFAGRIPEEEKVAHYRLADAFAMPGRGEGFGIVYLEALACGLPVLGSRIDGSRDALLDGRLGILVDPADPQDVLAGLRRLLRAPKGVPAELARFDRDRFEERLSRLLDEVEGRA